MNKMVECINVNILVVVFVPQDVTTRENWVKGTWDLLVLFLTIAYKSTIISK